MSETFTPTHQLPTGTLLNKKYEITSTLGEGGFGITYMGRNSLLDIPVAIKEYYPHGYANRSVAYDLNVTITDTTRNLYFSEWKEKFLKEAQTLAKFSNISNIVNVLDYFEENNTAYIVMEYLDGITLSNYISKNGVFDATELCRIMIPMLKSLNKIHQEKLIHRDISPDNIMVMPDGSLKLYDFGAARGYSETTQKTLSVILKPGFAPEEQYRSHGIQGPWTDVYAVCATIYFCITGVRPDPSIDRVFSEKLKRPSELGVHVSPQIETAILMGMSIKAEDRFRNAEALATAFERAISVSEQSAQPKPIQPHNQINNEANSESEHTEITHTEFKALVENNGQKSDSQNVNTEIASTELDIQADGGKQQANSGDIQTEITPTEIETSEENAKKKAIFSGIVSQIAAKVNWKVMIGVASGIVACVMILTISLLSAKNTQKPVVSDEPDQHNSIGSTSLMSSNNLSSSPFSSSQSTNPSSSSSKTNSSSEFENSVSNIQSNASSVTKNSSKPNSEASIPNIQSNISSKTENSSQPSSVISVPNYSTFINISNSTPNATSSDISAIVNNHLYDDSSSTSIFARSSSSLIETADRLQFGDDVIIKGSVPTYVYDAARYVYKTEEGLIAYFADYDSLENEFSRGAKNKSNIEDVRIFYLGLIPSIDKCLQDLKVLKSYNCPNSYCSSYYNAVILLTNRREEYLQTLKQYSTANNYAAMDTVHNKRMAIESQLTKLNDAFWEQYRAIWNAMNEDGQKYWEDYIGNWNEYSDILFDLISYINDLSDFTIESMNKELPVIRNFSNRLSVIENKMSGYVPTYGDQSGAFEAITDCITKAKKYINACEALFSSSSFDDEIVSRAGKVDDCLSELFDVYDKAFEIFE